MKYCLSFMLLFTISHLAACTPRPPVTPVLGGTVLAANTASSENSQDTPYIISQATPLPRRSFDFACDLNALSSCSNRFQSWGYSTKDRDAYNRPYGAVNAQKQYASYGGEFIRDNTPTIFLTFDEGYENGCTASILDTLADRNVSAVFFVTMPYVKSEPELIQRMIAEGHVIGSHSVSHPAKGMPSLSLARQLSEMKELHDYMLEHFNYEMYLFRYPAGIFSEQSLKLMQALGYRSVFWSFAYKDWLTNAQPQKEAAFHRMTDQLHNGAIYLLHAVSTTNTAILGDFVDEARARGFEFGFYN